MFILKGVTGDFIGHSAQVFILKGVKWGREAVERWKVRREFDPVYTRQSITKCGYCQCQFTNVLKIKDLEQERNTKSTPAPFDETNAKECGTRRN